MSVWKAGDTQPPMVMDCFDASGQPADLSAASTVTVRVWKRGTEVWSRAADNKPADGVVTLTLQPSDTQYPGTYRVKVRAVWPDGSLQHYPPGDNYMTMTVTR